MTIFEKRALNWIERYSFCLTVVITTFLALYARYMMRDYVSRDMQNYLIPWFTQIQSGGGTRSLSEPVGNYNILYQTLIAIMTYIPIKPLYQYKALSIIFDFLQAAIAGKIVKLITRSKTKSSIAYIIVIYLPTVVMNSSLWGQCDSIYSCFCLLSLLCMLKGKYNLSMISLGTAFAFKLQAIFFMPFALFMYIKEKKYSLLQFLWIPFIMIVLSFGGIIQGQPISNVFSIYADQTVTGSMSVNYPSLWALIIETYGRNNLDYYNELHTYAIALTFTMLLVVMVVLIKSRENRLTECVEIASLMVYVCIFFLPNMHERYGYLCVMLMSVVAFCNKKTIPAYIIFLIVDMVAYANYLFGKKPNWQFLSAVNFVVFCYYAFCILKPFLLNSRKLGNCT